MPRAPAAAVLATLVLGSGQALAAAPFLTDDPVPVDYGRSEFYAFSTYDRTSGGDDALLPAFEYGYGVLPGMQLQLVVPFARTAPDDGPAEWGLGDVLVGAKYSFVSESDTRPQIAVFPMAVLPTGDSSRGLGNGETWWRLPIWLQKSWGEWTTYGGAGYVINPAEGQKNHVFGSWLLQKDCGGAWTVGGELFARGPDTDRGRATTLLNLGGSYGFSQDSRLLFSAGHSVSGETHAVAYLGLWWGFGGSSETR
jgi:hypothetical protein